MVNGRTTFLSGFGNEKKNSLVRKKSHGQAKLWVIQNLTPNSYSVCLSFIGTNILSILTGK